MKEQKGKELYSIGEVSKICNISKKALRFYDQIGIFRPDVIVKETGYRYYSREQLLGVPVLKYYKQLGFRLEEMHGLIEGQSYSFIRDVFVSKISELQQKQRGIYNSYTAVKDWYELIQEAQMVIRGNAHDVAVHYLETSVCGFMEMDFHYRYMDSIINVDWVNYQEKICTEITGPVILEFPSAKEKMNGTCKKAKILQKLLYPSADKKSEMEYGGFMAATVYHVGSLDEIHKAYEQIYQWAETRGYLCGEKSYERYVVDFWTTRDPEEFVTEVIIPVERKVRC